MSDKELLVRGDVETMDAQKFVQEARLNLAQQAKDLLKYQYLESDLSSKRAKLLAAKENAKKAAEAFQQVGIQPYTNDSAEEYKRAKIRKLSRKYWLRNFANSKTGDTTMSNGGVIGVVSLVLVLGLAMGVFCFAPPEHWVQAGRIIVPVLFLLSPVGLFTWWGLALVRSRTLRTRYCFEWYHTAVEDYSQLIPDFALAHAVALKQVLPDARFGVNWLRQEDVYHPRLAIVDPFLTMVVGENCYYVDVWDEKDFEGRK
jgi:hypothetical protein